MKNTKRIFTLILSIALVMCVVASISSCKKKACEHTFSEEWTTDATNHWHAATCEHTEEKSDLAAHADANNDGKCDVCAYAMNAQKPNTPARPAAPKPVLFTVTVVNSKGEAVEGVMVQIVDKESDIWSDSIPAKATDAEGKVTFEPLANSGWVAQVISAPAGYASEMEDKVVVEGETEEDTITLPFVKKYEFEQCYHYSRRRSR